MFLVKIDGGFSLIVSELLIVLSRVASGQVFKLSSQNHKLHKKTTCTVFFPSIFFSTSSSTFLNVLFLHVPQTLDKEALCQSGLQ